ncbi:MAG: hypothetical protein IPM51_16325 [Sphingobacteriaceae bacterium]|nr:hypothetical protein [Sphingobacteriaceae bacterium]
MNNFVNANMHTKIILGVFTIFFSFLSGFSQKDTLHIYYSGMQTSVADSNDAKLTKWASKLHGKHANVEIYTYYENSTAKKFMAERAENLQMIVIRKARDYSTIKFCGPVKGKKSQRTVADVVFLIDNTNQSQTPNGKAGLSSSKTNTNNKSEESESVARPPVLDKDGYYMDSVYVNGKLKVTKRKVKIKYN